MAYLSHHTSHRASHCSNSRSYRIGNEFMKQNPQTINMQQVLLEKKFARKKKAGVKNLILLLAIFFSLLVINAYADDVVQADQNSLHTAAGAVSYSNCLDSRKCIWVK